MVKKWTIFKVMPNLKSKKSLGFTLMKALKQNSGFTLIELLIVISIIGVLAAVGFVSYSSAQSSARDSKRKQDLSSLATALELYYGINRSYPGVPGGGYYISTNNPDSWVPELLSPSKFINVLPIDPLNTGDPKTDDTTSFGYSYWSNPDGTCGSANTYFLLETKLENVDDSDSNKNKNYKRCDNSELTGDGIYAVTSE